MDDMKTCDDMKWKMWRWRFWVHHVPKFNGGAKEKRIRDMDRTEEIGASETEKTIEREELGEWIWEDFREWEIL